MSVIIKSNNIAVNNFGTLAMIGTTANAEFDKYKARVVADGGVIKNEPRTKRAFDFLFNKKMFGNMNSFVSGSFGAKLNGSGGVTKLYAIDGVDLIAKAYGTGTLPTLGAGDSISFAANSVTDNVNGAMFSSASKFIVSKAGSFGYGVRIYSSGNTSTAYYIVAALSKHNDVVNSTPISRLDLSQSEGNFYYSMTKNPLSLTAGVSSELLAVRYLGGTTPLMTFLSQPMLPYKIGAKSGVETTTMTVDEPFAELKTESFYLDFGGAYQSNTKKFAIASVIDFMCFKQATREQALALSNFSYS